jgi:plastocyanin
MDVFRQWKLLGSTIVLAALAAPSAFAGPGAAASSAGESVAAGTSTTVPSTQPAGFTIHGVVSVEQGWSLQKPNLSRVAIYLASDSVLDARTPKVNVEMEQYRKAFDPDFLIVPRGATVDFPNYDHFYHNVFSRSRIAPPFDLDRFPYLYEKSRRFDTPGVIHVFCNIHPQMHGLIIVTPNGIFARSDTDGHFALPPAPAGQYTLIAWYERSGEQRQPLTVSEASSASDLSIVLKENRESVLANVPPDHGSSYGIERGLGIKRERLDLPVVGDLHAAPAQNKH